MSDNEANKAAAAPAPQPANKPKKKRGALIRFEDEETRARIEQHRKRLEAAWPGVDVTTKAAIKNLILAALDGIEAATEEVQF